MESETIVACQCGARVRLPGQRENHSYRCPVCKSAIAGVPQPRVMVTTRPAAGEQQSVCSICQTVIQNHETVVRCSECDQEHHSECWTEIGGCGSYGCKQAPVVEKAEPLIPTKAWGDTKECPLCGETIKSIAIRCRFCDAVFDSADPMTRAELYRQTFRARERQTLKTTTFVLFVLSLLGLTSPIAGLAASAYLMPRYDRLKKCGPLYPFFAWVTLLISGLFTVLIAVFLIFEGT